MSSPGGGRTTPLLASIFAVGLAISLVMLARAQIAGDALALLTRGWLFAEPGIWIPFGNPAATTTGGFVPGGLTALVVGLPLTIWMDHRAPVVLILLLHVLAYFLLDRLVAEALGPRARVVLAVVYWLNPWRLYQSAWLDNSNYVFLAGAVLVWGCYRQRHESSWLHSALLVGGVGLTGQLHLGAVMLAVAGTLLWWRGYWRPHWGGVALGAAVTFGSLAPYFVEAARHPEIVPGGGRSVAASLVLVWPVVKGMLYWLRYASLATTEGMNVYDFTPAFGTAADSVLTPLFFGLGRFAALITLIPVALANLWGLRRWAASKRGTAATALSARGWLRGYALWVFVAGVVANALSPTSTMWWHNLVFLHASVLPLVLWFDALLRSRRSRAARRGLAAWAAFSVVLLGGMAFGSEQYRHGGREAWGWVLHRHDRIVSDLSLTDHGISIDPEHGSWPLNNGYLYETYVRPFELPAPAPSASPP